MQNDEWLFDAEIKSCPLTNFINLALEAIEVGDFDLYKGMIKHYMPHLKRDPKFYEYLERIAKYYFDGKSIKEANPMQAMM
jgi:hypothetical protein